MRILIAFLVGLFGFFYIGELLNRLSRRSIHSILGLLLILLGFVIGFFGNAFITSSAISTLVAIFLVGCGCGLTLHHLLAHRYLISERVELNFIRRHQNRFERLIEILRSEEHTSELQSPDQLSC